MTTKQLPVATIFCSFEFKGLQDPSEALEAPKAFKREYLRVGSTASAVTTCKKRSQNSRGAGCKELFGTILQSSNTRLP